METMAREMINRDPALKTEFDQKKATDKAFSSDPEAMRDWFYSKSVYWDTWLNLYPIGRIVKRSELAKIKL